MQKLNCKSRTVERENDKFRQEKSFSAQRGATVLHLRAAVVQLEAKKWPKGRNKTINSLAYPSRDDVGTSISS